MSIGVKTNNPSRIGNPAKPNFYNNLFIDKQNLTNIGSITRGADSNVFYDKVEISTDALVALKEAKNSPDADKSLFDELLDAEEDARNKLMENIMPESTREVDNDNTDSGIEDPTRKLTRRLVAAKNINQVHNVLKEAFQSLGEIIQAAAYGDDKAKTILRRLHKLIRRATRKVSDLNSEEQLRRREAKAKERELAELARQIELELKRKLNERKRREKKYLQDKDHDDDDNNDFPGKPSSGLPSEAQIKAMAWQAAQAQIAAQSSASFGSPGSPGSTGSNPAGNSGSNQPGAEATLSTGASGGETASEPDIA